MVGCKKLDRYPAITGESVDSFASYTIRKRLPFILDKIIEENQYARAKSSALKELKSNVQTGKIKLLPTSGEELSEWRNWLRPFIGKRWLDLPFYFAEAYFYRMILDRCGYFEDETDPFASTKQRDINDNGDQFSVICKNYIQFQALAKNHHELLRHLLQLSLWGNKSDLSQLNLDRAAGSDDSSRFTLLNDSDQVCKQIISGCNRVDILLDNAGVELFTDLMLADEMISKGVAQSVVLHTKRYPTFVSDATNLDVMKLCDFLSQHENAIVRELTKRIDAHLQSGLIELKDHIFWNSPLHFYDMPHDLNADLAGSDMIIFKGDANYRRIFGDKVLPMNFLVDEISEYLPARSVAIRILKSEIVTGLPADLIRKSRGFEPDWRTNGKYGLIQLIKK